MNKNFPPLRLSWTIWGLGALLYLIGFFQRVAPGVMTAELSADFGLNAAALGNLSAFYFYSYVAMQVPTGLLADRWGPRRLMSAGALLAGIGTIIFALASDVWWASFGRLMIGGSVAVAFVCMLKVANHWLPARQVSLAAGMALFAGIIGAVFAGVPLRLLVDAFGWRPVMMVIAAVTVMVALAIWWVVRDDPGDKDYDSYATNHRRSDDSPQIGVFAGIGKVLGHRNAWFLFLVPGGIVGSVLTFAGLWGVPFLTTHYSLEKTTAAALTSTLLVSWAVGGPVFGWLSDQLGRRKPLYIAGVVVALVGWSILLLWPDLDVRVLAALLVLVGFFSGSMIISFAFARESAPMHLAGTSSGIVNMGVMIGPMLLQPAVGWMLDSKWDGELSGGERIYSQAAYHSGFSLMLAWLAVSLLAILLTRETANQQML